MKFFPLFKLWARWFDGRRIFSMSRCVGISAARGGSPSAGRRGGLPKAVGSADADADGLCAAAGACGGDSGDPAAAGGLPQKRSPGGNSGDLRPVPTGQHHPVQPAGAGAVRPADAAAAVRLRGHGERKADGGSFRLDDRDGGGCSDAGLFRGGNADGDALSAVCGWGSACARSGRSDDARRRKSGTGGADGAAGRRKAGENGRNVADERRGQSPHAVRLRRHCDGEPARAIPRAGAEDAFCRAAGRGEYAGQSFRHRLRQRAHWRPGRGA